jgi:KDO2-lipid IV(A) lauroyltransferase
VSGLSPWARPDLLVKDLGGLALYYPGQALLARAPRAVLPPLARAGAGVVRRLGVDDLRAEADALAGWATAYGTPLRSTPLLVRDALRVQMQSELEVLRYGALTPANLGDTCVIEGRERLDAALARGRGAVLLLAHMGANQLVMPALGHLGYPMHQLSAPPTKWVELLAGTRATPLWARVQARRWALEQRLPVRHVDVFGFLRPAFAALAGNGVLGVAFDGGGGTRFAEVPFLGRVARLSTQSVDLARRTRAAALPALVVPGARAHRVVILEEVALGDPVEMLAAVTAAVEPWVAAFPEAYLPFLAMRRRVGRADGRPLFVGGGARGT